MRYGIQAPIPQFVGGVRKWGTGRNGRNITAVVIHRMEGTLDGSDSWLRSRHSGSASTHFAVGAWGWLNRRLHRYQIRQWVDTSNSAFGWAARPTDNPTPLAYSTLGADLRNSRADLNWQVIAVEVEGFFHQSWPTGLAPKVKELLAAISRSHGPLVVMAHTDCSSKPCPGMATFQAAMPGYYGKRLGAVPKPPAPKPPAQERDLYEWVASMGHQIPKRAVARKGAVPLKNPDGTPHSKAAGKPAYAFPSDTTVEVIGGTHGMWASRRVGGDGLFLVRNVDVVRWL